jgi:tRNA threonylcarbamoyladenosine biosynthesis protein TsaB
MNVLLIETSSVNCSVALSVNHQLISCIEKQEQNIHASSITIFIEQVLADANLTLQDLDAVAVGKGPGSYTGLRIGVSTAKALCYALNIPLIACNSLETLYEQAKINQPHHHLYIPLIDARRMEVYTCSYSESGNILEEIRAVIVDEHTFLDSLTKSKILFFGDGAAKIKQMYALHKNAEFLEELYPSAKFMQTQALSYFEQQRFEDVAYFEPYYLKEFYFNT